MNETPILRFCRLTETAKIPEKAHPSDSGYDICADEEAYVYSGSAKKIHTGIAAVIPKGYELQVRPRSGLAAREGVHAVFGTVDQDYRGEIGVTLFASFKGHSVRPGDRIAQLVLSPVLPAIVEEIPARDLSTATERGTGGFGSTGV